VEPEGSLPHSQKPATCPYPELTFYQTISPGPSLCQMFRNMVTFYGEELLAPLPTPKMEDHLLSAVRDCLFNVFAATLHIRRPFLHPQPQDAPYCGDGPTYRGDGPTYRVPLATEAVIRLVSALCLGMV
jgi:hypothetical protein